jgi:hypothetical protein
MSTCICDSAQWPLSFGVSLLTMFRAPDCGRLRSASADSIKATPSIARQYIRTTAADREAFDEARRLVERWNAELASRRGVLRSPTNRAAVVAGFLLEFPVQSSAHKLTLVFEGRGQAERRHRAGEQ